LINFFIFEKFHMNIKDANALKNINKKFDEDPMHIIQTYMN